MILHNLDYGSRMSKRSDGYGYNKRASYSRKTNSKKGLILAASAIIGGAVLYFGFTQLCPKREEESEIEWLYDYEKALSTAKKSDKPLMIDFYATWCGACKAMENTYKDKGVIEKSKEFVPLKIDTNNIKNSSIVQDFGIRYLPTIVFETFDGKELHRFSGYRGPAAFLGEMETALDNLNDLGVLCRVIFPWTENLKY